MTKINPPVVRPKVIVIVGPTASGKSDLAIRLAKKYSGEIISADSRQVYYGMNLGTGKVPKDSFRNFQSFDTLRTSFSISNFQSNPKSKILNKDFYSRGVKHHLIDVASPKKQFTASDFKKLGTKALFDIVPILSPLKAEIQNRGSPIPKIGIGTRRPKLAT